MIDFGIFEVQKNGHTGTYVVIEKLEEIEKEFNSIDEVVAYITDELTSSDADWEILLP